MEANSFPGSQQALLVGRIALRRHLKSSFYPELFYH